MKFFQELKRRNVFRVGIAYVLAAWVLAQAADFALDLIGAPNWILQSIVVVIAIGFPIALIFAWAFEMTPEGLRRESEVDRTESITPQTGKKLDRLIIVVMGVVIVFLLVDRFYPQDTESPAEDIAREQTPQAVSERDLAEATEAAPASAPLVTQDEKSIAVLPFVNMSADAENEFFSDGVSEEILNVLARVPELKVAARTSAFAYKGSTAKIADIARELGVNHVLEGSVRKAGDQVRVTAQLIQASDGFHLWSDTYDRKLDNIFAIQDEIAAAIAGELKVSLGLQAGEAGNLTGTNSLAAYEHYLQGMSLWHLRTAQSLSQAVAEFESAIELDPGFAKAHAGLALAWAVMEGYVTAEPAEFRAKAKSAAEAALARDSANAEALAALGAIARSELDQQGALDYFSRAIAINPSFATAYQWTGGVLGEMGDPEKGIAMYRKALDLDPRSRIISYNLAWRLFGNRQTSEAFELMNRTIELAPDFPDAWDLGLIVNLIEGNCEEVDRFAHKLSALLGKIQDSTAVYADLCQSADPAVRQAAVDTIMAWKPWNYADPRHPSLSYSAGFVVVFIELGRFDDVWKVLEGMNANERAFNLAWLRFMGTEQGVRFRCSQRFRNAITEIGLAPPVKPLMCEG